MLSAKTYQQNEPLKSKLDEYFLNFQEKCSEIRSKYANGDFSNSIIAPWIKFPKCNILDPLSEHELARDYMKRTFLPFWKSLSNPEKVKYLMLNHIDAESVHQWFKILC